MTFSTKFNIGDRVVDTGRKNRQFYVCEVRITRFLVGDGTSRQHIEYRQASYEYDKRIDMMRWKYTPWVSERYLEKAPPK